MFDLALSLKQVVGFIFTFALFFEGGNSKLENAEV